MRWVSDWTMALLGIGSGLLLCFCPATATAQADSTRWVRLESRQHLSTFLQDLGRADLNLETWDARRLTRMGEAEVSFGDWDEVSATFRNRGREPLLLQVRPRGGPHVRVLGGGPAFQEAARLLKEYYLASLLPVEAILLSVRGGAAGESPGRLLLSSVKQYSITDYRFVGPFEILEWSLRGSPGDTLEVSPAGIQPPLEAGTAFDAARCELPWHLPEGEYVIHLNANSVTDVYRLVVQRDTSWLEPIVTTFSRRAEDFRPRSSSR